MTTTTAIAPMAARVARAEKTGARPASSRWALVSLCAAAVLPSLNTSIANATLPTLARTFSASFPAVQWIVLSYLLATTTLIVSAGRLGDTLGRRRLLVAGILVFTGGSLACGLAPSLAWLIAGRVVQGLGAAFMIPLTLALVGDASPAGKPGRAMGLLGTMSALGTALGPTLGGVLCLLDWRAVFLVNVPVGALTVWLAVRHLPPDPRSRPVRFDGLGTLLLALTLAAYALAMTRAAGGFGAQNLVLLLAAFVALGLFLRVETAVSFPLVRLGLLRDAGQRTGLALSGLVATVLMTTLVVGPFYLSRALGLDVVHVGAALSTGPLVAALAGVPAGRLVDRFGTTRATRLGLSGVAAGCLLLSVLPPALGVAAYVIPLAVVTAGYALFQTANNAAVVTRVRAEERGMASGLLNLSRNLGLITGGSVMATLFAFASSVPDVATAAAAAVATGARLTFAVATLLATAGLVIAAKNRSSAPGP